MKPAIIFHHHLLLKAIVCIALFEFIFLPGFLHAQNYNIDDVNGQVLFTGSGSITLYDSGGASGNYGGGENYSVTICSQETIECDIPEINAIFNFIDIEYSNDCFYDGLTIDGETYCNANLPPLYGTTAVSSVSNASGCMVVHFYSDPFDPFEGFSVTFIPDQVAIVMDDPLECGSEMDGYIGGPIHGCPSCLFDYSCSGNTYGPYYGYEEQWNLDPLLVGTITITVSGDVDFFVYAFGGPGIPGCPNRHDIACGTGDESTVQFTLNPDWYDYHVIVDSEFGGEYHISMSCNSGDLGCDDAEPIECGDNFFDATFATTGGVNNVNDYCNLNFNYWTGREKVYEFVATYSGAVTITLTGMDTDLDLIVLDGCDATSCVDVSDNSGTDDESVTFDVIEGEHYVIVVDGYELAESVFWINVVCQGNLDCSDDEPLECGDVVLSSNSAANGGINSEVDYCGDGSSKWTGRERIYSFYAERNEIITITLSDMEANLDMFLLEECNGAVCADRSDGPGTSDETISFQVHQGHTYILVIDGVDGATSPYRLEVECESLMCKDCGDCFTYTIFDKGSMSNVACHPKYVDCGVDHYPSADHQFQWTVDGNVKSTKYSPTLSLENNKTSKVCQVVKYKGTEIFQCCWDIKPVPGCAKPPVAHTNLGGEWPFYNAVLDAGESTDGARYFWEFGDETQIVNNGNDPSIEHTYPPGTFKYSTYVQNDFGISVYSRQFRPGAIECTAGDEPKFTYTLSGRSLTVKDVDNSAASISSYKIDFGDSTTIVQGDVWGNKVHTFAKDSVYEICIRYVTTYEQGFFVCSHEGCLCFSVKVGCCQQQIDQCYDIRPVFISAQNGLLYNLVYEAADVEVTNWEIDGVVIGNSESNTLTYTFPSAGYYNVCCYYRNLVTGCYIRCCKRIYVDNPFTCGNIKYSYASSENGYRFELDRTASDVEEIVWTVDDPVSLEMGTNLQSDVLKIPASACVPYIISIRYYDKTCTCYRLCCMRLYLCDPLGCASTIKSQLLGNGKTQFSTDVQYQEMKWLANGVVIGAGATVEYQLPSGGALISLQYFDQGTQLYQECCRSILTATDHIENLNEVEISPNPASDYLNIYLSFNIPTRVGVELINEVGVVVRHIPMGPVSSANFNQRLETGGLAPGMYFLRVYTGMGEMTRKIICL